MKINDNFSSAHIFDTADTTFTSTSRDFARPQKNKFHSFHDQNAAFSDKYGQFCGSGFVNW